MLGAKDSCFQSEEQCNHLWCIFWDSGITVGFRHSSVFLPICPQDKLPSHPLWTERQSSCSRYRIKAFFTVFYMWFSQSEHKQWNHPPFQLIVCTFIIHNCSGVLLLQLPLCLITHTSLKRLFILAIFGITNLFPSNLSLFQDSNFH